MIITKFCRKSCLSTLTCLITVVAVFAQKQTKDLEPTDLDEVTIIAPRFKAEQSAPYAITKLDSLLLAQPVQQLSIKEQLLMIPGVFVQNAYNFAQDPRISIRGFGANAAFGIRGIKLLVDGIPETTPDGTGQLDNLNLDQIGDIQVIRDANSSLYGNASGGVIQVQSRKVDRDFISSQSTIGSYGFYSQSVSAGLKRKSTTYQGNFRIFGSEGYRDQSAFQQINARFATQHKLSERTKASLIVEYIDSPIAEDAGAVDLAQSEEAPSSARIQNIDFNAGEAIQQWKVGTSFETTLKTNYHLHGYAFYNRRNFFGRLPFSDGGIVDLDRDYFGVGSSLKLISGVHSIQVGYDLLNQIDDRTRYDNLMGSTGVLTFNQEESFLNFGAYIQDEVAWHQWVFSAGLRFDANRLRVKDRFLNDENDSGSTHLQNWNYQIGISRDLFNSLFVFVNHSTSFETPTLQQLSSRPDNRGGFADLDAASTRNYEVGGKWSKKRFTAEIVAFLTNTRKELVAFEVAEFPGRDFFQNTGATTRKGIEMSSSYRTSVLSIFGSYTLSSFTFKDFQVNNTELQGLNLPGTPSHFGSINISYSPADRITFSIPAQLVGPLFADNQNSTEVTGYHNIDLLVNYRLKVNNLEFTPFTGVRNLTNQRYFDNVRINGFGQRFYEAAPGINFYGGIRIQLAEYY
ncbi:MAG: TonB-dependent receptor [Bacteroidota bacterium]